MLFCDVDGDGICDVICVCYAYFVDVDVEFDGDFFVEKELCCVRFEFCYGYVCYDFDVYVGYVWFCVWCRLMFFCMVYVEYVDFGWS